MVDYIQKAVDTFTVPQGIDYNVVLVHYLAGSSDNPYKLRRTKVILNPNSFLHSLIDTHPAKTHEQALQEYIRYIDRDNTFLQLIVEAFRNETNNDSSKTFLIGRLYVVPSEDTNTDSTPILAKRTCSTSRDRGIVIDWTISRTTAEILIPNAVTAFFRDIYRDVKMKIEWNQGFELLRSQLFGKVWEGEIFTNNDNDRELNVTGINSAREKLNEISSVQGILAFLRATLPKDKEVKDNDLSCSFIVAKEENTKLSETSSDESKLIVMIASPPPIEIGREGTIERELRERLLRILSEVTGRKIQPFKTNFQQLINDRLFPDLEHHEFNSLMDSFKDVYSLVRNNSLTNQADCVILLASELIASRHEGKLQDFFMICGELSQFKDSNQIVFRDLDPDDRKVLAIPRCIPMNDLPMKVQEASRQLASEHYPWFSNGRCALFWDIAESTEQEDNIEPIGLVSVQAYSWLNVVQTRPQERAFTLPNCIVSYICGTPQKVGVLMITNNQVREVFRWHNNKWQISDRQRKEKALRDLLSRLLEVNKNGHEDNKALNDLLDIILQISEDPEKGGTFVFVHNQQAFAQFGEITTVKEMGTPWSPKGPISSDDVIALVTQDGATLCPLPSAASDMSQNWLRSWQYRKLLLANSKPIKLFGEIEKNWNSIRNQNDRPEWPLRARGSRRWNAAIAACNQYVNTVLVISQDGDIQIWHIDNKNNGYNYKSIKKLEIHEFPLEGRNLALAVYKKNRRIAV
jgi:hypothetical protein